MNTESRREFEKWANNNLLPINKIGIDQVYSSSVTEYAWEAWQAARERQDKDITTRKVFICIGCGGMYADSPVTSCDCCVDLDYPQGANLFVEGIAIYPNPPASEKI